MRLLLLLLLISYQPAAHSLPRQSLVPGGVAVIQLDPGDENNYRFRDKPVLVTQIDGKPFALVGLPLSLKAGEHFIEKSDSGQVHRKFFEVGHKEYSTQHIEIKDKRKVNPYASDMDRIIAEKKRKRKARVHFSRTAVDVDFLLPLEGTRTGSFGRRRVFNGQARNPHSGMDIAAATGVPVLAPSAGKVIELGDFFFSGNLVYLDHGQGLISLFAHLSEIDVELGQQVGKGQVVGKVGATGRVTGPHLHWSLGLNGTWIDPALFIGADN
ncbi:MAG: M23 family metallopeptidase [Gammaproteobacteria bacterium]|nr:M23 family metallopeptidase [Gammaproteobacteria bacterium]